MQCGTAPPKAALAREGAPRPPHAMLEGQLACRPTLSAARLSPPGNIHDGPLLLLLLKPTLTAGLGDLCDANLRDEPTVAGSPMLLYAPPSMLAPRGAAQLMMMFAPPMAQLFGLTCTHCHVLVPA